MIEPLREFLDSKNNNIRSSAVFAAGRLGADAEPLVPELLRLLRQGNDPVRIQVIRALGNLGINSDEILDALLARMNRQPEMHGLGILSALAQWERVPQRVEPILVKFFRSNTQNDYHRAAAVRVFGKFEEATPEIIELLREVVRSDGASYPLPDNAVRALGEIGESASAAIPDIVAFARSSRGRDVVGACLARMGEPGVKALGTLLRSGSAFVQATAMAGIAKLGKRAASLVPILRKRLKPRTDYEVRKSVLDWFAKAGPVGADAIGDLLADFDELVRNAHYNVAGALAAQGEALVPHVPELVKRLGPKVRLDTQAELCQILAAAAKFTDSVLAPLRKAMTRAKPKPDERLDFCRDKEAIRRFCVRGLGNSGEAARRAVDDVSKLLFDPCVEVRRESALALGKIGSSEAVDGLRRALVDADDALRAHSAEALGRIGSVDRTVTDTLAAAVGDKSPRVRKAALTALGRLGTRTNAVEEALQRAGSDQDKKIRELATSTAKKLGAVTLG